MQDARYSIGWFVWPCDDVLIQGPGKKYPPTTMKEFMKVCLPSHMATSSHLWSCASRCWSDGWQANVSFIDNLALAQRMHITWGSRHFCSSDGVPRGGA